MSRLFNRLSGGRLFYGNTAAARARMGEIDLRREMTEILRGWGDSPQRGHWIAYRRFDTTRHSANYDEVYRTGVGGPAYEYTDELIITRKDPIFGPDLAEASSPAGILKVGQYIYYFEYDFIPSLNDQIFEISWDDHTRKPPRSILNGSYADKFNIKEVFPYRLDGGRIEYWQVYVYRDQISY